MEIEQLRAIAYRVFKTYDLNPNLMNGIFYRSPNPTRRKENHCVHYQNPIKFGDKSLRSVGVYIWNSLLENIKSIKSLHRFKDFMKRWPDPPCKYNFYLATLKSMRSQFGAKLNGV